MNTEELGAEIVKAISAPGYGHAENIFLLLEKLELQHGHDRAVVLTHHVVVVEGRAGDDLGHLLP